MGDGGHKMCYSALLRGGGGFKNNGKLWYLSNVWPLRDKSKENLSWDQYSKVKIHWLQNLIIW